MTALKTTIWLSDVHGATRQISLDKELASGGAGTVYSVDGEPAMVLKRYHDTTLVHEGATYAEKIACMLKHVPMLPSLGGLIQLSWPLALARDDSGKFIGFAMPAVDFKKTELLESMLLPIQAKQKNLRSDLGARLVVAANLAGVVSAIHDQGHHIVDLKPPNLRVYRQELYVALLDCDGFSINVLGKALKAPQATPEYLAPEFHNQVITAPEQQDRFALAVILFRLLNFGIHPYDGKASSNSNAPTDREGRVASGMYPYGFQSLSMVAPLPQSAHHLFPDELRHYFDRAFGSMAANRPSAHEWFDILRKYGEINKALIQRCSTNHFWFTGQSCGVCHREGVLNKPRSPMSNQSFDLARVWREIKSVTPPPVEKEIEPDAYALTPLSLSEDVNKSKRLVSNQRMVVLVLAPILWRFANTIVFEIYFLIGIIWLIFPFGRNALQHEIDRRVSKKTIALENHQVLMNDWNSFGSESIFFQKIKILKELKNEYEGLTILFEQAKDEFLSEEESKLRDEYLENFSIEPGAIDGIGPALIDKLNGYGIFTATDINQNTITDIGEIPGFGEARVKRLAEWRDDLDNYFSFDPASVLTPSVLSSLKQPFDQQAFFLETDLNQGFDQLNICKKEILQYRQKALQPLCEAAKALKQMEVDLAVIQS